MATIRSRTPKLPHLQYVISFPSSIQPLTIPQDPSSQVESGPSASTATATATGASQSNYQQDRTTQPIQSPGDARGGDTQEGETTDGRGHAQNGADTHTSDGHVQNSQPSGSAHYGLNAGTDQPAESVSNTFYEVRAGYVADPPVLRSTNTPPPVQRDEKEATPEA